MRPDNKVLAVRVTNEQHQNIEKLKNVVSKDINVDLSYKDLAIYALSKLAKDYKILL